MKSFSAKRVAKVLIAHGFVLVRQKGSHQIFAQESSGVMVVVPFHNGTRPIPVGTFLAIVKQSKIPKKEFS